jgi:hypothetical protein
VFKWLGPEIGGRASKQTIDLVNDPDKRLKERTDAIDKSDCSRLQLLSAS